MDKGYEREPFRTVCIKLSVLRKFKGFSKRQGTSHSMTLLAMVEFFEENGISPDERMYESIASLKYLIKRRFNAMVAIMRSIEKEQTAYKQASENIIFLKNSQFPFLPV